MFSGIGSFRHAEERRRGEASTREHTLALRVRLLHVLKLAETRAEDVVRNPAKHRGEHEKDGNATIKTRDVTERVRGRFGKLRGAEQRAGGETAGERARGASLVRLGILRLHLLELSHTRAKNVIRNPSEHRSEHRQEHERASIERRLHELLRRVGALREKHGSRDAHRRRLCAQSIRTPVSLSFLFFDILRTHAGALPTPIEPDGDPYKPYSY